MPQQKQNRQLALRDVAHLAGASVSTVSRVLAGKNNVASATARRVMDAVRKTGFVVNPARSAAVRARRAPAGLKYGAIAIASGNPTLSTPDAPYPSSEAQHAIGLLAREMNIAISVCQVTTEELDQRIPPRSLASAPIDGILMQTLRGRDFSAVARIAPTVLVGSRPVRQSPLPVVEPDSALGVETIVDHLYALGHRRLAFMSHYLDAPDPHMGYLQRRDAFLLRARELGCRAEVCSLDAFDPTPFADAFFRADPAQRPTAVVVCTDMLAIKLLSAFAERGVSVPGAVSVTGFDGYPVGKHVFPSLTTWRPDWALLGRTALRTLLTLIAGDSAPSHTLIGGALEPGASTAPPST